ncbi:MAG: O-antigen ligase family protein [Pirellulales bacterium]|nr:O-antigen ligase family protein [Pirellulales bacterium]
MKGSKPARSKGRQPSPPSTASPARPVLRRPAAWLPGPLVAIFVLRPLYPSESVAVEGDGLVVAILWLLLLAAWAWALLREPRARILAGWPDLALGLLAIWHSIAAVRAFFWGSPRPALNMLWEWVGLAAAFFLARQSFRTGLERRAVAAVMIAVAATVSVYGLYQVAIELPATRALYQQASDETLREAGLWFPPGSPQRQVFEQRLESREPMATFALANSLAGFLAPWSVAVLAVALFCGQRPGWKARAGAAGLLIPLGLCLLLTKSRSAYLAVGAGTVALGGLWWSSRPRAMPLRRVLLAAGLAGFLLALVVAGAIGLGQLDAEVLSEAPKSLGYRMEYWRATLAIIRDAPVFGCGPGNFQEWYTAYKLPEASEEIADPHNFLFEVWATAGSPAALLLCVFLAAFAVCNLRSREAAGQEACPPTMRPGADEAPPRGPATIYLGGLAGLGLLLPIGAMSAAPPSLVVAPLGLLAGGATLVLLDGWVRRGEDAAATWTVAAAVMLLHLLFAGGIGFPGVAASLWLLLALALNTRGCGCREVPRRVAYAALLIAAGLIAGCFFTGYRATVRAQAALQRAYANPARAREALAAAAEADRWAVQPRGLLADLAFQEWLEQPTPAAFHRFETLVAETLLRAPRSASRRHGFGVKFVEAYARSGDSAKLAQGIETLRAAARLYPNNCRFHAELAEAYRLAGDMEGYARERKEALRLDQATPHLDKKLSDEQRLWLERNNPG